MEGGWCGTQGRTDSGLSWAPHPVTTLGVYKVLGIILGFWQKAMEPKSLGMVLRKNLTEDSLSASLGPY